MSLEVWLARGIRSLIGFLHPNAGPNHYFRMTQSLHLSVPRYKRYLDCAIFCKNNEDFPVNHTSIA